MPKRAARRPALPRYPDLLAWRLDHQLTSAEAARVLNVSQTTYSRLERRARAVKGPGARRLMILTGVPLEILTGVAS